MSFHIEQQPFRLLSIEEETQLLPSQEDYEQPLLNVKGTVSSSTARHS